MLFTLGPRATKAGYGLVAFDQIGSTNAEALTRARDGERGPCWFVTTEQTAGSGRRQRAWIAPPGNPAASRLRVLGGTPAARVLEILDVTPASAATLGFAAGLALGSAVRQVSLEAALRSGGGD